MGESPDDACKVVHDLLRENRHADAQAIVDQWASHLSTHQGLAFVAGVLANRRGDWTAAEALWSDFRRNFPDAPGWSAGYGTMLEMRQFRAFDRGTDPGKIIDNALLLKFESLGSDCEFGLMQRRFGAERIGLLRWTGIGPEALLDGLHSEFEGIGAPDQTGFTIRAGEYFVTNKRYRTAMHTRIRVNEMTEAFLLPKMCRWLQYLKTELLADLRKATKIFVFKHESLSMPQIMQLHQAVRAYGDAWLLCVREAGQAGQAGTIETVQPGLMLGYIDRFTLDFFQISAGQWRTVCAAAAQEAFGLEPDDLGRKPTKV